MMAQNKKGFQGFDHAMRQQLAERRWLDRQKVYGFEIQGVNPDDPNSVGIIPISPHVYEPAGGVRKLKGMLLEE